MEVEVEGNRRRSSSDPLRLNRPSIAAAAAGQRTTPLPEVQEDDVFTGPPGATPQQHLAVPRPTVRKRGSVASIAGSLFRFPTYNNSTTELDVVGDSEQFDERLIDVLDTVGMFGFRCH